MTDYFTRLRDGTSRRNYVESTLTVEVIVGAEGCEDSTDVDVRISGNYTRAEPDIGLGEGIEDLAAWIDSPYGPVDFDLSEDDEDRAVSELLIAWHDL